MDKLNRHLQFLKAIFAPTKIDIEALYISQHRSIKKTLFEATKPAASSQEILLQIKSQPTIKKQQENISQWLNCFCPNDNYTRVVKKAKKGIPFKLDTDTLRKLELFRRAPSPEELKDVLFWASNSQDNTSIALLLSGLTPFGRHLSPHWSLIDQLASHSALNICKAAVQLLVHIPNGVQKSIMTIATLIQNKETQLTALMALQHAHNLPSNLVIQLLQPIVEDYRRKSQVEGPINQLWQEYRIIQSIYKNNGIQITLPTIKWKK